MKRRDLPWLILGLPALVAVVLLWGWRCPILALTSHPCPGCGMTRAAWALLRFDLAAAWSYNPMIFLLPPVVGLSLWDVWRGWSARGQGLLWGACVAVWLLWFLLSSVG